MRIMTSLSKKLFIFVTALVFLISSMSSVSAISKNDYDRLHAPFYDDCVPPEGQAAGTVGGGDIEKVYMVGDSITLGAKDDYDLGKKFTDAGIDAHITASGGAGLNHAGSTGSRKSGLQSVKDDGNIIKDVDAVVVAHTTNDVYPVFEGYLKQMIKEIKKHSESVTIFWVNAKTNKSGGTSAEQQAWSADAAEKKNKIVQKQSSLLGFTVIDIASTSIPLASDGIHPDFSNAGHGKWGDAVVGGVTGEGAVSPPTDTDPLGELCCPGGGGGGSGTTLRGSENAEKIFNFLVDKNLTPVQAAGVVGNFSVESGFDPFIQEVGQTPPDGGYGIAQWTGTGAPGDPAGARRLDMIKAMKAAGIAVDLSKQTVNESENEDTVLAAQLDYMWKEATDRGDIQKLKQETTIRGAIVSWLENFEVAGIPHTEDREAAGQIALDTYGGGGGAGGGGSSGSSGGGNCSCEAPSASGNLDAKLKQLADANGGKTRISVEAVKGGTKGNAGGNLQMPTRSTYKVYTAYATLKAIEAGTISWSTQTSWGQSVEATMEAMIVVSDNDAAYALRTDSRIGDYRKVTNILQNQVGLSKKTVMGSGDTTNSNSRSTANDFTKFLVLLEKKKLPGVTKASNYDKLLSFMKRATTDGGSARAGIVAGVGEGVEVADKAGWAGPGVDPASNDVGIVYLERNPYIISILTDTPNQWDGVANIAKGVHAFMGGNSGGAGCTAGGGGDAIGTVLEYAWHDGRQGDEARPAYAQAVRSHPGEYAGGCNGQDCGAFVTRVMRDSGADPNYNSEEGNTVSQKSYLDAHPQKYQNLGEKNSTDGLQPGDIAITEDTHTFIYVGEQEGFEANAAHASLCSYMPTANNAYFTDANGVPFTWYRLK